MNYRHGGTLSDAHGFWDGLLYRWIDASASLSPYVPWVDVASVLNPRQISWYPPQSHSRLCGFTSSIHGLSADHFLFGNGAAELFTWASRDACACGQSILFVPSFVDYMRALNCWSAQFRVERLSLNWNDNVPSPCPLPGAGDVLWICNPHNPTGQLWSRDSLEPLLESHALVICDEAFLPLVPDGDQQSLIPLVAEHSNLVVIRSLTKLYGIAGLRLGYAVAQPQRLQRWAQWRDPWPVNGIALAVGERLLASPQRYRRWCKRVQRWTATEGAWMHRQLAALPGITPMPSAVNYLLIRAKSSLVPLREALEQRHRILLRDCRSFEGLGETWLRIGLQSRRNNRRIVRALRQELQRSPLV